MRISFYISRAMIVCSLLIAPQSGDSQEKQKPSVTRSPSSRSATPTEADLAKLRADVIEKMKESRTSAQKLLALHEGETKKLTEEYTRRRELYNQGLISRAELEQAERAVEAALVRVEEDKRWIAASDIAITEATMHDELLRLPALTLGGYSETDMVIRFNGGAVWSLAEAPEIEKFFAQNFGRVLPVSAYGQTAAHDRLRFDHKNALDVALHPDSSEGRSLMAYLRQAGIPFIAFRNAMPGAATGAHIHIGRPSLRDGTK